MTLLEPLQQGLDDLRQRGLYRSRRVTDSPCAPQQSVQGERRLNFNSNDYLGLAQHPEVCAALQAGVARYGAGSGASHLISGHSQAHEALEAWLAAQYQPHLPEAAALLLSSGYMANMAVLGALAQSPAGPAEVFSDALNHASLIDGMRLARCPVTVYPHQDLASLAQQLQRSTAAVKIVATDSVFSMDGSLAPLPALLALCERHGAWLVVDDAHGLGVLGPTGLGALQHFALRSAHLVLMGTLGKAAGVAGAFVLAHRTVIDWLIQRARTYIYTTAAPPALAHALLTSLAILTGQEGAQRRSQLAQHLHTWKSQLPAGLAAQRQTTWAAQLLPSDTPIQPLVLGSNAAVMQASAQLWAQGIWVSAIRAPTVPPGTARLRITFSAAHRSDEVQTLLAALGPVLQATPNPLPTARPTP